MNSYTRGVRNAFRNSIRTVSIVIILGASIALALIMLLARQAVENKISTVKSQAGSYVSIAPAGFNPMSQANNALTSSDLDKVKSLDHVSKVAENLTGRLTTEGTSSMPGGFGGRGGESNDTATTSLKSAIDLNSVNKKGGPRLMINGGSKLPSNFSLPVSILGTTDPTHINGTSITIKGGQSIEGGKDANEALVSADMAKKNNLKVGSTFKAYNKTIKVVGIFDSSNKASNDTVVMPLAAVQRLSGQSGDISSATATVDSIDNLDSTTSAIKSKLGNAADVTSSQENAKEVVQSLESIKSTTLVSLIGAVIAGVAVILLTMVMIVRERRREVGVLKAIGATNRKVIAQFVAEAVALTLLASVIGLGLGVLGANPITKSMVSSSQNNQNQVGQTPSGVGMGGGQRPQMRGGGLGGAFSAPGQARKVGNITVAIGWQTVVYGVAAALVIALLGSALPAWLITKIRPAEVMRAE